MPHHEQLLNDPVGALRRAWDDTGCRAAMITAALIFIFEAIIWAIDVELGVAWIPCLIALLAIGRFLTLRPLRGDLHDAENLSLLLGLLGVLAAESIFTFTTVGDSFAAHAIFWPFALTLMAVVLAARSLAEYATRPLVAWALLFSLLFFSAEMIGWASNTEVPNPSFSWGVIATVLALFARWVVGRGFAGAIVSPLNVATSLFIFLVWWLQYGAEVSGVGADPWGYQEVYWPWILMTTGIAVGCAIVAPCITDCLNRRAGDAD